MSAKFWICFSFLVVSLFFMLLNKKIRCSKLVKDLFKIFYDNRRQKISIIDLISFFACPIIIGVAIAIGFDYCFSIDVSNALLTIFSILFTLLFGVMSLLTATLNSDNITKKKVSNEAFTAVAFAMFISLIVLILMIVYIALLEKISAIIYFKIFTAIIISLAINMIMLFFMIIKRSYITSTSN